VRRFNNVVLFLIKNSKADNAKPGKENDQKKLIIVIKAAVNIVLFS
jgi:hypothetical protein